MISALVGIAAMGGNVLLAFIAAIVVACGGRLVLYVLKVIFSKKRFEDKDRRENFKRKQKLVNAEFKHEAAKAAWGRKYHTDVPVSERTFRDPDAVRLLAYRTTLSAFKDRRKKGESQMFCDELTMLKTLIDTDQDKVMTVLDACKWTSNYTHTEVIRFKPGVGISASEAKVSHLTSKMAKQFCEDLTKDHFKKIVDFVLDLKEFKRSNYAAIALLLQEDNKCYISYFAVELSYFWGGLLGLASVSIYHVTACCPDGTDSDCESESSYVDSV